MSGGPLSTGLVQLLNRLSELDPDARKALRGLEGRVLGIELLGPGLTLMLSVQDGVFVSPDKESDAPTAWLRTSPGGLLAMAASGGQVASGHVELSGDAESARRFQAFFRQLSPDWEEAMTKLFGDVIGVQLHRLLSGGLQWAKHAGERLSSDASEFLREESRQLVPRPEMEQFLDAVDDLRDDAERLLSRAERILAERETGA